MHNIVKNGDGVNEFDANYNVDQNEDQAKENDDEDFENQDDKEKDDDGDKENEGANNGQDSNQADENFRESYEQQEGNQLNEDDEDSFSLPPKDGSLKVDRYPQFFLIHLSFTPQVLLISHFNLFVYIINIFFCHISVQRTSK